MATAKKKAPAKKAASKQPNPPSPAKAAGKVAGARMSKETSAATRDKAAAYKKSGASYLKKGKDSYYNLMESPQARSKRNDLSGSGRVKFDPYGMVSFTGGRTSQRAIDQAKRKKK